MSKTPIYLDYAAATPMDMRVIAAMQPYLTERFYNPSALYLSAKAVAKDIAEARATIAKNLGARPGEVIFTAGGTEANNLAIHGVMRQYPEGNMVVSAIEHDSVLHPAKEYAHKLLAVQEDGRVEADALEELIDDHTVLVSVIYANNEIGTVQSLASISNTLKKLQDSRKNRGINRPLYFHTDACQAPNYLDVHASRLGVDLMSINGGKIYGPKQSGALFVRAGVRLAPVIQGGGQEFGLRSGTENVSQIIGLATSLQLAAKKRDTETNRMKQLQQLFFGLVKERIPAARLNGSLRHRLPNNVHLTIDGTDNERLIMALDESGIQAAAGSACSASNDEPSHVLRALGMTVAEAQASLRFTMGRQTTEQQIRTTVDTLAELVVY